MTYIKSSSSFSIWIENIATRNFYSHMSAVGFIYFIKKHKILIFLFVIINRSKVMENVKILRFSWTRQTLNALMKMSVRVCVWSLDVTSFLPAPIPPFSLCLSSHSICLSSPPLDHAPVLVWRPHARHFIYIVLRCLLVRRVTTNNPHPHSSTPFYPVWDSVPVILLLWVCWACERVCSRAQACECVGWHKRLLCALGVNWLRSFINILLACPLIGNRGGKVMSVWFSSERSRQRVKEKRGKRKEERVKWEKNRRGNEWLWWKHPL